MFHSFKVSHRIIALASALALPACVISTGPDTAGEDPTGDPTGGPTGGPTGDPTGGEDPTGGTTGEEDPTGDDPTGGDSEFVGRWAGVTLVDDFDFAPGRDVRLDEIFVLEADGLMRGDFSGWDEESGCVVLYRLDGTYAADGASIDVGWDSIRLEVTGCIDDAFLQDEQEVDAEELTIWDDELDGTWLADAEGLTITTDEGAIQYSRVESLLVARWHGSSVIDDFEFALGSEVTLDELFWMNDDGSMFGYFSASHPSSGCYVDYRMTGSWSLADPELLDAQWDSIWLEVWGCTDEAYNEGPADVTADEGEIWDDELDGTWDVVGDQLLIMNGQQQIVYSRDL